MAVTVFTNATLVFPGALQPECTLYVRDGRIEAIEGAENTDAMLARLALQRRQGEGGVGRRRGVLVKRPKPRQEMRVDMPAIGPRTVVRALEEKGAIGEAFNIGNPRSTVTIYHLARMVIEAAKSRSEIRFIRWDFTDVELRVPDVKKAEERLGFRAQIDLDVGLARTIEWYQRTLHS